MLGDIQVTEFSALIRPVRAGGLPFGAGAGQTDLVVVEFGGPSTLCYCSDGIKTVCGWRKGK